MRLTILLFICAFEAIFSTLSAQATTQNITVYEKQGKPRILIPKWQVTGKIDTFRLSMRDIELKNGDTIKDKSESSIFMHRVDAITSRYIDQTFWLSQEKYNDLLNTKTCNLVDLGRPFLELKYRTPKSGKVEDMQLLNCDAIQKEIAEHYAIIAQCEAATDNDYLTQKINAKNLELVSNCEGIGKIFYSEILWLHLPYGQLIPKKGMLRYKTAHKFGERTIDSYTYVNMIEGENGHRQYEVGEDTSKGAPAFVKTIKTIEKMTNPNRLLGLEPSQIIVEEEDKQIFEVDPQNYPVYYIRTRYSRLARNKEDKANFVVQKLERIGQ